MAGAGERTERPTPTRLRKAREKGQIARSRDAGLAVTLVGAIIILAWYGGTLMAGLRRVMAGGLGRFGQRGLADVQPGDASALVLEGLTTIGLLVGPIALTGLVAGVAGQVIQGGWNFAPAALTVDPTRLSPKKGLQRLKPSRSGVELLKSIAIMGVLATVAAGVLGPYLAGAVHLTRMAPADAAMSGWLDAQSLLVRTAVALIVIGLADYGVQRWRLMSSLKMTKQEVKDDMKSTEGSPEMRYRIRKIQREIVRRRMLSAAAKATVVITNPTHFAVALQYDRQTMAAPRVLAKGRGHLALRIRAIARDRGIPIVENPPLAQALYKTAEPGDTIPAALYGAVAEVLAYLIRLKQLAL